MPFQNCEPYPFNRVTMDRVFEVGGVYGLARPNPSRLGWYFILYVGKSGNLRERLQSHLNNPPVAGITHFFVDRIDSEAMRTLREAKLIAEFNPAGNTLLK
jgi:excinuclease UvrABC nuclease subunit